LVGSSADPELTVSSQKIEEILISEWGPEFQLCLLSSFAFSLFVVNNFDISFIVTKLTVLLMQD
jgi:hypothetical protein